ncbi:uncharacterized protein LOC106777335 isoform X1 [Vigna radiata var. radiata]|uniref:Uncharacterized protein LOC106777335 isoform X1 n=1 Tax=Vigna radiata var. radiata TaxID=3916 RepID=A0A3Q0EMZ5_VIGRR|nr:uncharacterized protein LOC106777335 isoform X1 [Vigna radiata var. radiata]
MASEYTCTACGSNLYLNSAYAFPPDFYFEAGNKDSVSFSAVDASKFKFEKEDKIRPFFETVNYWGIQRKRTKIKCNTCSSLLGHIYDDGPPLTNSPGQFHMGPSQVIPREPRYRLHCKLDEADPFNLMILIKWFVLTNWRCAMVNLGREE